MPPSLEKTDVLHGFLLFYFDRLWACNVWRQVDSALSTCPPGRHCHAHPHTFPLCRWEEEPVNSHLKMEKKKAGRKSTQKQEEEEMPTPFLLHKVTYSWERTATLFPLGRRRKGRRNHSICMSVSLQAWQGRQQGRDLDIRQGLGDTTHFTWEALLAFLCLETCLPTSSSSTAADPRPASSSQALTGRRRHTSHTPPR